MHRMAVMLSADDRGWSTDTAGLVAMALHPFDDQPVPLRGFEKAVRKEARRNARGFRKAGDAEAAALARQAVSKYRAMAIEMGEPYYATRYDKPLGLT